MKKTNQPISFKLLSAMAILLTPFYATSEQDDTQFKQYSTHEFSYTASLTNKPIKDLSLENSEPHVTSDKIHLNYFNTGITRVKITNSIQDGQMVTLQEIWKTKNPSYITFTNMTIMILFLFSIALWLKSLIH